MPGGFSQERPAGAGRTLDVWFPDVDTLGQNGAAFPLATGARGRPGGSNRTALGYTQSQSVGGTGAVRYATGTGFNGRGAVQMFPGAAGTAKMHTGFVINPSFGAAAVNAYRNDPHSCYRLLSIVAFGAGNNVAAGETSCVWIADSAGNTTISGGAAGFGIIQTGVGEVSFIRRSVVGGGVVTQVVILSGTAADILNWHAYEFRVIGATATTNAQLKMFLDDRQVNLQGVNGSALDWVADGLPNPLNSAGNIYGFNNWFHGNGTAAAATGIVLSRQFMQVAPTETDLL